MVSLKTPHHHVTYSLLAIPLLIAVVALVYVPGVRAPFIFDDKLSIIDNASIEHIWPLIGDEDRPGPLAPPRDISTAGRPLVNLSFAVNYHFGGLDPTGYHFANIVIHALSAMLLWAILRRTLRLEFFADRFAGAAEPLALGAAVLWAVHPLVTEAVEYITQRTELMLGFFYLATLYAALRFWESPSRGERRVWLAVATVACLLGMACKEVMVTAPLVIWLFERTFIAGSFRRALEDSWPLYFGLGAGWCLLVALNLHGPRAESAGFHLGVSAYAWWLTQTRVLCYYFQLIFWPWPLVIHYELPYLDSVQAAWPWVVIAGAFIVATAALVWRRTATGFVGAWVLLILSPTLVVPIVTEVAAERRMYLPLAAIMAWLLACVYLLLQRAQKSLWSAEDDAAFRWQWAAVLAIVVVLCAVPLGWVSAQRVMVYNDAVGLWQDAALYQPDDARVQNNLGVELVNADRPDEALPHYERALQLKPDYVEAQSNIGVALVKLDRPEQATIEFEKALALDPRFADAHINLGHLLAQEGHPQDAIAHYRQALERKPRVAEVHANLGHALAGLGESQPAIKALAEAVRLDPDFAEAHLNLGAELAKSGQPDEAARHYAEALRARPDFVEAHNNWGVLQSGRGETEEAIKHFQQALQLRPDYAEAHSNLGIALFAADRTAAGLEQFEAAAQLKPEPTAFANLATAYAQLGRSEDAIASAQKAANMARAQGQFSLAAQMDDWLRDYRRRLSPR
ncbi:MAG TPA: tetratricopeptide repeat protein [Pirellulales bacterium]|jgi:tetratricopeptide (TPR) repeat protein